MFIKIMGYFFYIVVPLPPTIDCLSSYEKIMYISRLLYRILGNLKGQCHAISVKLRIQSTKLRICINQDQKIIVLLPITIEVN